jgi:hypothetical protein
VEEDISVLRDEADTAGGECVMPPRWLLTYFETGRKTALRRKIAMEANSNRPIDAPMNLNKWVTFSFTYKTRQWNIIPVIK